MRQNGGWSLGFKVWHSDKINLQTKKKKVEKEGQLIQNLQLPDLKKMQSCFHAQFASLKLPHFFAPKVSCLILQEALYFLCVIGRRWRIEAWDFGGFLILFSMFQSFVASSRRELRVFAVATSMEEPSVNIAAAPISLPEGSWKQVLFCCFASKIRISLSCYKVSKNWIFLLVLIR